MREESAAHNLFRQGRFAEAARSLNSLVDDPALAVELQYFLGHSARTRSDARRLVQSRTATRLTRARASRVLGSQLRDDGAFKEALDRFRTTVDELEAEDTNLELALAYCSLLECECDSTA